MGTRRGHLAAAGAVVAALLLLPAPRALGDLGHTRLVSTTPGGDPGTGDSGWQLPVAISGDGTVVAFPSEAADIVPGDVNDEWDVVVRDLATNSRELATVSSAGVQADQSTFDVVLSRNGRFVAYDTDADNLVAHDTNTTSDVFVHDRTTGATTRVSVSTAGTQGNDSSTVDAISADGRYVLFGSFATNLVAGDTNGQADLFLRDRTAGTTTRVSVPNGGGQPNGASGQGGISADGSVIAFTSSATNLVAGDTNGVDDVFVRDLGTGVTRRADVSSSGAQANGQGFLGNVSVSDDGNVVAFESYASNLVPKDTNDFADAFVHYMDTGRTVRVSVGSGGRQIAGGRQPVLSGDGQVVGFLSFATDVTGGIPAAGTGGYLLYVHDMATGGTMHASVDNAGMRLTDDDEGFALDRTGRRVLFGGFNLSQPFETAQQTYLHDRGPAASDVSPPTILGPPQPSFADGMPVDDGQVGVRVSYWAHDEHGVCVHDLERRVDAGSWQQVPIADPSRISATSSLDAGGAPTRFRVAATDCLGNASGFTAGAATTPAIAQETDPAVDYSPGWTTQSSMLAMDGARQVAHDAGAWARYTFTGSSVAWIADRGPAFGKVKVYLDGKLIRRVGLFASSARGPREMFAFTWPDSAQHRLRIVSLGTAGHPAVDVDAFASLP